MFAVLLQLVWILLSIFLIFIIFSRVPRNQGLTSFATKSDLFGSPNSTESFLNNFTFTLIVVYYFLAIQLNALSVAY